MEMLPSGAGRGPDGRWMKRVIVTLATSLMSACVHSHDSDACMAMGHAGQPDSKAKNRRVR